MTLKKLPERVVFRSSTPSVADIFVAAFFDCVKRYHNDNGPDNRIVPVRAPEIFAIDNITLEKIPDENDELALVLKDQCDKLTSAWYDYYEGGITFESAKANNFETYDAGSDDSPAI